MTFLNKTVIKRLFLYGFALISGLVLLSPFIINWGINTSLVKNKISSVLYQKTGTHIDSSKFSITIFPNASISVHKFNFNPDNKINFTIKFLKFNFDIQQLLQGKINVSRIIVDHPEIKPDLSHEDTFVSSLNVSASNIVRELKKIFTFLPEHQDSVELRFKNAASQYFKQMDGSIYLSKEKEEISLNTTIKKIKLSPASFTKTGFEAYSDMDFIELDQVKIFANINSKGGLYGRCSFIKPQILSKKKELLIGSDTIVSSFKISEDGYQLVVTPFKLNYPEGTISAQFSTSKLKKESIVQFTGTHINIDPAGKMAKRLFKKNEVVKNIFQIVRSGVVPKVTVSFHDKVLKDLFNEHNLKLKGNIEKGSVNIPETDLTATDVYGFADIQNGILDIHTKKAVIQNSILEKTRLSIDLLNYKNFPFQGEFLLDIDLSMIPKTLISLLPGTFLSNEMSLVHNVEGRTKAELTLLVEPEVTDLVVKIKAPDLSLTGFYERIPGKISIENINFNYEPDMIILKNLTADINGNTISNFNTFINFKNDALINIQSGSGYIDISKAIPWLRSYKKTRNMISPVKKGKGKIHFSSVKLSGRILNPELWKFELKGTTNGINISTKENKKQIQDLFCQYYYSNNLFNLKNINTKIHDLSWLENLIGRKHLDSIFLPFDMENGNFQMKAQKSNLKADLKFSTGPKLSIDLKGDTPVSFNLNSLEILDGNISDTVISFNYSNDKPLVGFKGILNTTTLNKLIKTNSFWSTKIYEITEGKPILIYTDMDSNLNINIKTIDLTSIISETKNFESQKSSSQNTVSETTTPDISEIGRQLLPDKTIFFKTGKLKIKQLTFNNIDSQIFLKKNHSQIMLNKALLCDLKAKGSINITTKKLIADIPFKAYKNDNIQDLFTCLLGKNGFMDGQYSFTGHLKANTLKKNFLNKIYGNLTLNAHKGRIYKLTLLSRILSILNVSKFFKGKIPDVTQNGFAYNKIIVEAQIKDSIIYLKKAIIDGQDMALIFSGWIDPLKDTLDLTCLVAPFKTIDLIIKKIPIVSTLLGGRLVSVPLKASGKLSDPVVILLHPSAVGEGLITMMSDILKTPVKLWDKFSRE